MFQTNQLFPSVCFVFCFFLRWHVHHIHTKLLQKKKQIHSLIGAPITPQQAHSIPDSSTTASLISPSVFTRFNAVWTSGWSVCFLPYSLVFKLQGAWEALGTWLVSPDLRRQSECSVSCLTSPPSLSFSSPLWPLPGAGDWLRADFTRNLGDVLGQPYGRRRRRWRKKLQSSALNK